MTTVTATLVFDSWLDSTPECRSRAREGRHLIYEGGGIILDLLLKPSDQEGCTHVGGQILTADSSSGSVAGIAVQMKTDVQNFTTHTNAFGEFAFKSVPLLSVELCIVFPSQRVSVRCMRLDEPHLWQVMPMMAARGAS